VQKLHTLFKIRPQGHKCSIFQQNLKLPTGFSTRGAQKLHCAMRVTPLDFIQVFAKFDLARGLQPFPANGELFSKFRRYSSELSK
jgi:hypothetical protein